MYAIEERRDTSNLNVIFLDRSIMLQFPLSVSNTPYFCMFLGAMGAVPWVCS
jgi:hypothetical protein